MQKLQRTFKIGEEVVLRDMRHIQYKYRNGQPWVWTKSMTTDFETKQKFQIVRRDSDKWYRISSGDNSWFVRYNWIESTDQIKKIEQKEDGPIAKILWDALTYLQIDETYNKDRYIAGNYTSQYTCDCIDEAQDGVYFDKLTDFLESLGFDKENGVKFNCFNEFKEGEERQGARFQWLYTAYWIAKDLGI